MKFQRSNILEKIFQQCSYLHYIFLKNQHYAFISSCQHIQLLMYFLKKIISPMAYSSSQCQLLSYIVTGYRHCRCQQCLFTLLHAGNLVIGSLQTLQSYQFRKKNHFSFCFQTIDFLSTAHTFWLLHTMMQTFQSLLTLYLTC